LLVLDGLVGGEGRVADLAERALAGCAEELGEEKSSARK
jgi:hypothetical protein